ncbi:hypothetical protein DITRI_Ditri05aG0062200 [Diplodiscus trichospermus]
MSSSSTANSSLNVTSQTLPLHSHALQPSNNVSRNPILFVRRLCLSILSLFAIISLVHFIVWCIIHPVPPVFKVNSFCISSDPLKHSQLLSTGYYDIRFAIKNPNRKLSLVMDHSEILVYHGKNMVSKESMPPFYIKKMSEETRKNVPRDLLEYLHGKMLKLKSIEWSKREVSFDVKVNFRVKYLAWSWLPKRAYMEISCRDLRVTFLSAKGKWDLITAGRRECLAHFL